jgi:hypothetical protein
LYLVSLRIAERAMLAVAAAAAVAGCGGGHALSPGQADAAAACRGSGAAAALAATKAAAVNPGFSTLAADENALAGSESAQTSVLSDGSDDSGTASLVAGVDLGSAARQKVIADCASLGLPVVPVH